MNDPENYKQEEAQEPEHKDAQQDELEKVGAFQWTKLLRVLVFRIPIWLVLFIAIVIGGFVGYSKITTTDPVSLRPAVIDAKQVTVHIYTCDAQIDKRNLNIRKEELRLMKKLHDVEHVVKANVQIDRNEKLCSSPSENK